MEFLTSGPLSAFLATFLLGIILWICYRTGRVVLLVVGFDAAAFARIEERLFSIGLGMLVVSALIFLLGISGGLSATSVTLVLVILLAFTMVRLNRYGTEQWGRQDVSEYFFKNWFFCLVVGGVFFLAWIQALTPPIGNDALAYHLYHAKEFILRHKIEYLQYSRESLWPYFTETFFMLGLLLEGTILPQLFHWAFYVMTAALVYSFGRRFFNETLARWALVIFIFTPVAFAQAGHAYVDLVLAFFVFAGVYAFLLYDIYKSDRIFIMAGALIGGAVATKYLGLGAFAILGVLVAVKTKCRPKALLYYGVSAFLVSGFWYIHSWIAIGNPVYPFFPKFFGGNGFEFDIAENVGMGKDFFAFLRLPWNMTMHPWNFGGEMIGSLFLMFAPFAIINIKNPRPAMTYAAIFTALYTYFLFTQSQHLRFYLSVAPILSVAAAVGIRNLCALGTWPKRCSLAALAAILCLHGLIFAYRTRNAWPVVLGQISAQEYLLKYERSFEGYQFFKKHLKSGERFFNAAEVRYFYNPAEERMSYDSLPLRLALKKENKGLSDYLESNKFNYFWLAEDTDPDIKRFVEDHDYLRMYSYESTEKPKTYRYDIYRASSAG